MKIFHLFLLSVLISPACIFAQDKNRLEETNQVTSCRLQVTNQVIGCRLQVVGANQAADHTVGRRSTELPLVDLSFQIDRGGKTTTNCELRTTNCDSLGQDLSCHLMMDPAELKNIENGTKAIGEVLGLFGKEAVATETAVVTGAGRSDIERVISSSNDSHQVLRLRGGG